MKRLLKFLFGWTAWWNSATLGTHLNTRFRGRYVGQDAQGNKYYEERRLPAGSPKARRWVIYNGPVEASRVPAEWHAWLHHIVDYPPDEANYAERPWIKPHRPNMTGTPEAYRPDGSLHKDAKRPAATGDYEPWVPNGKQGADEGDRAAP